MTRWWLVIVVLAACGDDAPVADAAPAADVDPLLDPAAVEVCLPCHSAVGIDWQRLSSHRLLFSCAACHAVRPGPPRQNHADRPSCGDCHSEAAHPDGATCRTCHETHGAANAFLLRASVALPGGGAAAVHVTTAEGASADGLARAGVPGEEPGTGLCEVCHEATRYYDRDGAGEPHDVAWCGGCHVHDLGFAAAE